MSSPRPHRARRRVTAQDTRATTSSTTCNKTATAEAAGEPGAPGYAASVLRRLARALPVLVLALLTPAASSGGASPHPEGPITSISSSPSLFPAFRPDIRDYVVRCRKRSLHLRAKASSGSSMTLDGSAVQGSKVDAVLRRRTGEATNLVGRRGNRRVTYHLRCLPPSFPEFKVRRSAIRPQAQWYLTTPTTSKPHPGYVAIFDGHGVPVWWMHTPGGAATLTLLPHNRLAWSLRHYDLLSNGPRPFEIHALDGVRKGTIRAPHINSDWHELHLLANGHFLVLGDRPRRHVNLKPYGGPKDATVLDGVAEELTPKGRVVWSWNSRKQISLAESRRWYTTILSSFVRMPDGRKAYDIVHLNSLDVDGPNIVISSRHTDAVFAVSKKTGRIAWKLGGTHTSASLAMADGSPAGELFGGQHDVRVLPDGTITAHDNRALYPEGPRAVRIRIDQARRRARVIDHVGAPSLHAAFFGSARKLPGGHWVVSWGSTRFMAEITASGKRVLDIRFGPFLSSYRVIPLLPGQLPAAALRRGMDAMAARAARG
jgi:hypothetical protein